MKTRVFIVILCLILLTTCKPAPTPAPHEIQTQPNTPADTDADPAADAPLVGTIIVTSTEDSGPGTLREALEIAQDEDIITFDLAVFPPDAPATIYITCELPHIRVSKLTIDASNAGVIVDGQDVPGDWVAGLQIVDSSYNAIMGLHVARFPGPGIAISGNSENNVIGGDRGTGVGPYGQGNLLSNNEVGIDITLKGAAHNTVTGNFIGTDAADIETLGNKRNGISIWEGAHDNTIGPDNIIAYNGQFGVYDDHTGSGENIVSQNSIYDNGIGKGTPAYPVIFDYNISAGTVTGATCPNCTVEVYSTADWEGETWEGEATADAFGVFTFEKGGAFTGPKLSATVTGDNGINSGFSWPTWVPEKTLVIQQGNDLPRTQFQTYFSSELADNHIATQFDSFGPEEAYDLGIYRSGVTRARVAIAGMEPELVNWDMSEFSIDPSHDAVFNRMADAGFTITYVLTFWDKETYPNGEGAPCARFKTEGEIERYLEFVRFTVNHFKDRVQYFEIWNEPDIRDYCPKWIQLEDYINLVKRAAPVIREEAPEAKIVVGAISNTFFEQDYLWGLLESDIMPLVDVISWHPMYGASPDYPLYYDYYYDYPKMLQRIKDTAAAHGFDGEYHADELSWNLEYRDDQPWVYTPVTAAKYFGRAALLHLGTQIDIGLGSGYIVTPRLTTVMAGAEPIDLQVEKETTAEYMPGYSFSLPDNGYLVSMWTNGVAQESDPGVLTTVTIPGFSAEKVIAVDILYGLEQELVFEQVGADLVIRDLLVRDYPLILKFESGER